MRGLAVAAVDLVRRVACLSLSADGARRTQRSCALACDERRPRLMRTVALRTIILTIAVVVPGIVPIVARVAMAGGGE